MTNKDAIIKVLTETHAQESISMHTKTAIEQAQRYCDGSCECFKYHISPVFKEADGCAEYEARKVDPYTALKEAPEVCSVHTLVNHTRARNLLKLTIECAQTESKEKKVKVKQ